MCSRRRLTTSWCEYQSFRGFVRAPHGTYSALAYIAVGAHIALAGIYDLGFRRSPAFNKLTRYGLFSLVFGLVNL
jgi:hypothetical protein